jgi:hypothetical protein
MKLDRGERRLGAVAVGAVLVAFACSSRHRLGRLEGDDAVGAAASGNASGAGASASSGANGGTGAANNGHGHAGENLTGGAASDGSAGDNATPRPEPGVFVAQ